MKRAIPTLILICLLFNSCQKKIDGSTKESLKKSIAEIEETLDKKKKKEFRESMGLILFRGQLDFFSLTNGGATKKLEGLQSVLDGMTADDIIAEGNKIRKELDE
ncbi:DUF6694 family lipoprotein [Costertonia aggregata]|uniref:Uncharacterized protein n=1 Tax=Costertonia aggregata TaxID=343403 RepID=A0A7H9ATU8_9FLAO|nr:DUF6694 family lipoprotein [Costertonia aggregata]QLG46625.1 hypothetical protein HYG79_15120 [Costertonia aggregata]